MQVRKIGPSELSPPKPAPPQVVIPKPARRPILFALDMMLPTNDAEALSQKLMFLPTPTIVEDEDGQLHLMPPPPGKPNPEIVQIEEYASLERLQKMIDSANKAVACLAASGTSLEIKNLYMRLSSDLLARRFFLLNRNPAVMASRSNWNEGKTKHPMGSLLAPFILYKQVEKQLEAYAATFEPLKDLAKRR